MLIITFSYGALTYRYGDCPFHALQLNHSKRILVCQFSFLFFLMAIFDSNEVDPSVRMRR